MNQRYASMLPFYIIFLCVIIQNSIASYSGWNSSPNTQYHIQTDEGPERYFRYQTQSGQYRKEKRLKDGTVVGSYGWVDADGYLRLRDYIADGQGYRILKSKTVFVGDQRPIQEAVAIAKHVPAQAGILADPARTRIQSPAILGSTTPQPPEATTIGSTSFIPSRGTFPSYISSSTFSPTSSTPIVYISPNSIGSSTDKPIYSYRNTPSSTLNTPVAITPSANAYPVTTYRPPFRIIANDINDLDSGYNSDSYPSDSRSFYGQKVSPSTSIDPYSNQFSPIDSSQSLEANGLIGRNRYSPRRYQNGRYRNGYRSDQLGNGYDPQFPYYDGVSVTKNGFRYYLPKQYHEEESSDGNTRTGSFGYVDPFGIRRVVYYNTEPGSGFQIRKNNRYVGQNATPYDPRPL